MRMKSLYVEPSSETSWNRPADISAMEAHNFLQEAVNDYTLQAQQNFSATDLLASIDAELYEALVAWSERPTLPPPEHPEWPKSETAAAES
jgi:hypothetical protein